MAQEKKISFVGDATTKEAFIYILRYNIVIVRNACRGINRLVYRFPWAAIIATVVISFIVSFVFISKARAERDSYNHKLVHVSQQLDSYKACYDNGKGVQ